MNDVTANPSFLNKHIFLLDNQHVIMVHCIACLSVYVHFTDASLALLNGLNLAAQISLHQPSLKYTTPNRQAFEIHHTP